MNRDFLESLSEDQMRNLMVNDLGLVSDDEFDALNEDQRIDSVLTYYQIINNQNNRQQQLANANTAPANTNDGDDQHQNQDSDNETTVQGGGSNMWNREIKWMKRCLVVAGSMAIIIVIIIAVNQDNLWDSTKSLFGDIKEKTSSLTDEPTAYPSKDDLAKKDPEKDEVKDQKKDPTQNPAKKDPANQNSNQTQKQTKQQQNGQTADPTQIGQGSGQNSNKTIRPDSTVTQTDKTKDPTTPNPKPQTPPKPATCFYKETPEKCDAKRRLYSWRPDVAAKCCDTIDDAFEGKRCYDLLYANLRADKEYLNLLRK